MDEEQVTELQVDGDDNVTISDSDLFDGWDDDVAVTEESSDSDETPEVADQPDEEVEQPEEKPVVPDAAPKTEEPKPEEPKPDTDQYLELKHLDEVRKVSKEEARVLAQKGMDYDRIRTKYDEATSNIAKLQKYESFLNEIKGDFATLDDLMTDTRARILSDKESISYEDAVSKVKAANQHTEQKTQEQAQPQITREDVLEEMRRESCFAFKQKYPDVPAEKIPKEVWDDMQNTNSLVVSYERYVAANETNKKIENLMAEIEAIKQNKINEEKAVGSLRNAGSAKIVDKYLEGWDDD